MTACDVDGFDGFDSQDWSFLPPVDAAALPDEPRPAPDFYGGITIGSELAAPTQPVAAGSALDLGCSVHEGLASVRPGVAELARLGSIELDALDAAGRVDALLAIEKQLSWLQARRQHLLAAIATDDVTEHRWCVEEVGAALRLSGAQARGRLAQAEQLVGRLPGTLQALSDGELTTAQAEVIAKASFELPDELLGAYEARLLPLAPELSSTALARSAHRAAHTLDPATMQQRTERAIRSRNVRIAPAGCGTSWLIALLPAADAQAIYARIDAAARTAAESDSRTLDQRRADALVGAVLSGIDADRQPVEHGRRPGVNVTISLPTLVGADQQPGWLDGYGPISADYARRLAHDPTGTWRRLVTDPVNGQLIDCGTTRYRPPQHLADHVIARDGQCTFPFCSHSASASDLDHVLPFPRGRTEADNLQPVHRRHHNAKTKAGWQNERDPVTGNTTWISPQGRRYRSRPPERWTLPDDPPF